MGDVTKPFTSSARTAAVLWDMDGTIVDTEPYWIATEYELVAEHGGEWSEEKAHSLVGKDLRDSAAIIRDEGGVDLPIDDIVNRLLDGVIEKVQVKVPWRPGAREILSQVRKAGVPNALVTMSWKRFADAVVSALPPGSFDVVITGDEVSHGKPHPEPYLAAAKALGVDPKHCVAIEDSPTGVRSAVAAGCTTFAVPNVVDIPESDDYTRVSSLLDLDMHVLGIVTKLEHKGRNWKKILGATAVVALAAGGALVLRAGDPPPFKDMPISGWAPYWTMPFAQTSIKRYGSLMHEVSPFWFTVNSSAQIGYTIDLALTDTLAFVDAIRVAHAKVLPSISDGMPKGQMAALLADPAKRAAHVQDVVKVVDDGGYDGIDLDYEQFAFTDDKSTWETVRVNWVAFVTELSAALHKKGKQLSVSLPPIYDTGRTPDSGYWVYDYAAMGRLADHIRIMAYDYSVSAAGPIAPLDWVRTVVRAAKKAVLDHSKLELGVGLYGRNWVISTDGTCPATAEGTTAVTQQSVGALIAKRQAVPLHDTANGESSFVYQLLVTDTGQRCTQTREVHYVDVAGAKARIDLARTERIGGVSLWALGFDTGELWTAITPVARPQE
jgi:HAD superfamily hydrolase (TIGR01509 family)